MLRIIYFFCLINNKLVSKNDIHPICTKNIIDDVSLNILSSLAEFYGNI